MKGKGFTLVELLAVIVVLGIILAIAVPKVTVVIRNSKMDLFRINAKQLAETLENERLKNTNFNPTTIDVDSLESELSISNKDYESIVVNIINDKLYVSIVGRNKWANLSACGTKDNVVVEQGTVCNADSNSPVITMLGNNPLTLNINSTYTDAGATALDDIDGDLTDSLVITNTVNTNISGYYTVTYKVTDAVGNVGTAVRDVYVVDHSSPVITLLGESPVTVNVGDSYSDAGATALDDIDGDITSSIVTTSTVDINTAGTYIVTYTVSDTSGNIGMAVRTVNVVDSAGPTVAFSMNGNSTYAKSRTTTVTVSDNIGVDTGSLKYLWTTSSTAPSEASINNALTNGSSLSTPAGATGSYYLWILAKDVSNNKVIIGSNVFNLDNIAPVITMSGSNPISIALGTTYSDAGATATDNINGTITGSISTTSTVNPNIAGAYTVTYNVSDTAGNSATAARTVNVLTMYRYRDWVSSGYYSQSCSTCYQTCYNTATPTYSCSYGTLSGSQCISTHTSSVSRTCTTVYECTEDYYYDTTVSYSCTSYDCSGSTSNESRTGSCSSGGGCSHEGDQTSCSESYSATCTYTTTTSATATCPSGYTLSGSTCQQAYNCNGYTCNCTDVWNDTSHWGDWSSWSTTPATASGTKQVQTCTSSPCSS